MVSFKLNEKQTVLVIEKILGQFAFLVQRELIERFPPSFKNRIIVAREGAAWIVGSNYKILRFYDKGTRPHIIEPKVKNALAFAWPKAPAIPNQPSGSGMFVFKKVLHPGTQGMNIIEDLEKDKRVLEQLLGKAIRNVVK